jgi:hypothetical protein
MELQYRYPVFIIKLQTELDALYYIGTCGKLTTVAFSAHNKQEAIQLIMKYYL